MRLPDPVAGLEAELEAALRKKLHRGSITLTAGMADAGAQTIRPINEKALSAYLGQLQAVQQRLAASGQPTTLDLTSLLSLPGVLEAGDTGELLRKTGRCF
ncbi:MAG: hypothetical protein HC898_02170 [Phycisphaerales bacterium]|nr:hypothetical protein [Phycisphaerales bacterium]